MEPPPTPPKGKRIISEARGKYVVVDESKIYEFEFPSTSSLAQNYDVVSLLKDEIWNAMQKQKEDSKNECEEKECSEKECKKDKK